MRNVWNNLWVAVDALIAMIMDIIIGTKEVTGIYRNEMENLAKEYKDEAEAASLKRKAELANL